MIKVLKTYRNLTDVVVCEKDGVFQMYAMVEDPAIDNVEESEIINRLQTAFKIKLEK